MYCSRNGFPTWEQVCILMPKLWELGCPDLCTEGVFCSQSACMAMVRRPQAQAATVAYNPFSSVVSLGGQLGRVSSDCRSKGDAAHLSM